MPFTTRVLCWAVALLTIGLSGCAVREDHTAGAADGDDEATLPTLPSAEERLGVYDENGCLRVSPDEVDCETTADDLDEALAQGAGTGVRTLAGFSGPYFTEDVSRNALVVLEDTVATAGTGTWSAQGLIRNETTSPVVTPTVTAVLRGSDGAEVATVSAEVPVRPVRPGEPAPFHLAGDVPADQVASVDWAVDDAGGDPPPGTRDLELTTWFIQPYGLRDPMELYLHHETGPGPHPYVLFGAVTNQADIDATEPLVVAAWLGDDGRVRTITDGAAVDPSAIEIDRLSPGRAADFLLSVDDPATGPGLDADDLLLWAVSR